MLYPNTSAGVPAPLPTSLQVTPLRDASTLLLNRRPAQAGASASLMLLGVGARLAMAAFLSGAAFLGVAWAIA